MSDANVSLSQNLFDVNNSFFLIDSISLNTVQNKLYGYCIQDDGIYEDADIQAGVSIRYSGRGAYVGIERSDDKITIYQDYNGSYGLYLFREGDYFALSNSFLLLVDHLKAEHRLSMDMDYAHHIFRGVTSIAYSETIVREITLLEKNACVHIDIPHGRLRVEYIDYQENTVEPNSAEGMAILDRWYHRWTDIIRSIYRETQNIQVALSGGFDSRTTFLLALKSGIDLNNINIRSLTDGLHTHAEDFKIATEIAEHFGFKLNNGRLSTEAVNFSLEDIINISFYTKLTFHQQMYFKHRRFVNRFFGFPGAGGENIRAYWSYTPDAFYKKQLGWTRNFSQGLAKRFSDALTHIVKSSFDQLGKKYHITDPDSPDYSFFSFRDTYCRNHFGKNAVEDYFTNSYTLSPLMDHDLYMLKPHDENCDDRNLIMTLIYERYCPELLDFPIEGNRSIAENTRAYARQISGKYPFHENTPRYFTKKMAPQPDITRGNPVIPIGEPDRYLLHVFNGRRLRMLFDSRFSDEIYRYAQRYKSTQKYFPLAPTYDIIGIAKILEGINAYESTHSDSLLAGLDRLAEGSESSDITRILNIYSRISDYITARIDVKQFGTSSQLCLQYISDSGAKVTTPDWLQMDGHGFMVESQNMELDMVFQCLTSGHVRISLRGVDRRDADKNRIPVWIFFHNFTLNGKTELVDRAVWHDKPYVLDLNVREDDVLNIHAKWEIADITIASENQQIVCN